MTLRQLSSWSGLTCLIIIAALVGHAAGGEGSGETLISGAGLAASVLAALLAAVAAAAVRGWNAPDRRSLRKRARLALSLAAAQGILAALLGAAEPPSAVRALLPALLLAAFTATLQLNLRLRRLVREERGAGEPGASAGHARAAGPGVPAALPRPFRNLVRGTAVYAYVAVYIGAYVQSATPSGCAGWPFCEGQAIPEGSGDNRMVWIHLAAQLLLLLLAALVGHLAFWNYGQGRPGLRRLGLAAALLSLMQLLALAASAFAADEGLHRLALAGQALLLAGWFSVIACLDERASTGRFG
ncbi:hypothetical protein [Paenibacillus glufosinatiresistens]|uniref:hypothetical protein n=1 Tax=Paenibacillus glufosinatiresistens TaxID=3070657 RepID=UPI00286E5509|nr:hypothetical protein [Paenibacillus sp. YX.27]